VDVERALAPRRLLDHDGNQVIRRRPLLGIPVRLLQVSPVTAVHRSCLLSSGPERGGMLRDPPGDSLAGRDTWKPLKELSPRQERRELTGEDRYGHRGGEGETRATIGGAGSLPPTRAVPPYP